ncbi:MAG TPA: response regulator transcription factor [Ktedonobacterales bacterium]|jgi:two-component system, OmpR family, KDP operon response regulator KdpE|nr:response regulator transcription factor [Ktedonobacterales bacterium]
MPVKLLIADDSPDIAEVVAFGARMSWPDCIVGTAANGQEALNAFAREQPDLVILDVAMPPPDGFEVCQRIRAVSQVPILMLTVRDATPDKVRAFDLGADDYLAKPFDHSELLARLKALMRRSSTIQIPAASSHGSFNGIATCVIGAFVLNYALQEVRVDGTRLSLTSTEYRLLEELVRNAGTVLSHHQLLERVWGPEYVNDIHYLKVFVQRLRSKLNDDPHYPRYIHTEWGRGYRFTTVTEVPQPLL